MGGDQAVRSFPSPSTGVAGEGHEGSGRVLVITGPTAVGKSALALELAARLNGEIVSADSRQVYRYMDVGTAKPTVAERAAVPHHMIDVVYPNEPYSVETFRRGATRAVAGIFAQGHLPLVVGGSPHYIQALVDGLRPPPRHPALRAWIERVDASGPPDRLDTWLHALDPEAAGTIDARNRRRVVRAIEVVLLTGRRFSDVGRRRDPPLPGRFVGLRLDRPRLYERVRARIASMVRDGWVEEVRMLLAMGYSPDLPAMSATGYAELARAIRGQTTLEEALGRVELATHAFIRQQETWLRRDPRIQWFDADETDLVARVLGLLTAGPSTSN